ncbi:MAG: DUF6754 domain-containing protein [Armatimonadota bacterium]
MQHAFEKIEPVLIVEVLTAIIIIWRIISAQRGKELFIRRIPGLNAIDEAIGRATEMGRPVLMVPGIGGFSIIALQALSIFSYIARSTARFGNRTLMPVADATVYTVAEEVIRDAYQAEGHPERFDPDSIRFLSDRQFAFASGVAGLIQREQIASSFMFGEFFAESLIFAETGNMVGAIQVAGTVQTTQIPFFIAACDYTIIGDEYYAASAYISRNPTMLGSLVGQDFGKLLIALLCAIGAVAATLAALEVPLLGSASNWLIDLFTIR